MSLALNESQEPVCRWRGGGGGNIEMGYVLEWLRAQVGTYTVADQYVQLSRCATKKNQETAIQKHWQQNRFFAKIALWNLKYVIYFSFISVIQYMCNTLSVNSPLTL